MDAENASENIASTSNLEEKTDENKNSQQKKLFYTISIGSNSSQLILLNFFQYFAAEVGVTQTVMGFVTAIRNLLGALFQGRFGLISDKHGRKILLLLGFFLSFAFTTLLIFSYNTILLIIVATAQAFALSIIIPVWNATLGDVTEIKGRTTYIGILSSIGQIVGVILMLVLAGFFYILYRFSGLVIIGIKIDSLDWKVQYGIVFGVCAFCFLLAAICIVFLKETRKKNLDKQQPKLRTAFQNKSFRKFIVVNSFFGVSMAALWPIYPEIQVNIMNMEIYQLTFVAAIYAIFFSIAGYFGGKIGDRIGRKPVLIFSRIIMFSVSLLYIPAALSGSWFYIILTNIVSGFGNGIFLVMMNAYALDLSSEETLGVYSGLAQASWGVATFVGSLVTGFIADYIRNSFGISIMVISITIAIAVMRVIASIGYFFVEESLPRENRIMRKKDYKNRNKT
ncbi:MAG TPA: MFS transporter [candidate division Zixibacteria bacterium]|nr:MFS transporter [candidate division Zixibacteria bacterium]